jgi:hypothetical protein
MLVKASITLFVLGASFLLGGLKHHAQGYNRINERFQAGLLFLATIALGLRGGRGVQPSTSRDRCGTKSSSAAFSSRTGSWMW